jgi:FKBP-type peptidyl-prolyl cis-trans isomerase
MKKHILAKLGFCGLALHLAVSGQTAWADDAAPKTEFEKIGYAVGLNLGSSIKQNNLPADPDFVGRAAKSVQTGAPALLTDKEVNDVLKSLPAGPANLAADDTHFKNVRQEVGYAVGASFGKRMKRMGVDLDVDNLVKGLKDALAGGPTLLTTNEIKDILTRLQAELPAKSLKAGQNFLEKNKSQAGVKVLDDGLQYKVINLGNGPKPKLTDTVSVNYRGTFFDGDEFDASPPGSPIKFPLTGVIPGWTEILQLMPTGSKWQVYIPSDLAYGPRGQAPKISPNSTLIFDIELLSIVPPASAAPPTP